jgi:hypothetical protein
MNNIIDRLPTVGSFVSISATLVAELIFVRFFLRSYNITTKALPILAFTS